MSMNYKQAEAELAALQAKNETIFRTAVYHLFDVGRNALSDEAVEATCAEIMGKDDSRMLITNGFQCDIVRTAGKLAKYDVSVLMKYLGKHMKVDC